MIASSGYYQVTREQGKYSIMEYYQQCQLTEESITRLYIKKVKKMPRIKFIHEFSEYASTFCANSTLELTN